jgi:alpha-tubulin suppressor-like RCC1 family protein
MKKLTFIFLISFISFSIISCSDEKSEFTTSSTSDNSTSTTDNSTTTTTLSAPSGLTATGTAGQVILAWTALSEASSYTVYWDNSTGVNSASTAISSISTDNYTHSGRDNGTTYYYKVAAVNSAGTGTLSSEISASTPLPTPANFSATSGNGKNTLDWDAVSGATSYTVYWGTSTGISSSSTAITSISSDNYSHSSLTNSTTYYYKVAAVNTVGTGTLSSEVNATPSNPANRIATGEDQSCAVLDNASLKCWGEGYDGQLGNGSRTRIGDSSGEMGSNLAAIDLGSGRTATAVSAGKKYTCALLDDASVKCWGVGAVGQLGLGSTTSLGDASGEMGNNLAAIDLGSGRSATAISAGYSHTCALLDDASVKCWGSNAYGQLGQGNTNQLGDGANEMGDNLAAIDLGSGRTATAISAGKEYTCAILDNASIKCWGANASGQLGLGDTNNRGDNSSEMGNYLPAVDLGSGKTAKAIAAGDSHTCAILDDSSVKCWGDNAYGRLGQGSGDTLGDASGEMGDNLVAIDLGSGRTATAISAGKYHTCALLDNSAAKCWGANDYGELGQGNTAYLGSSSSHMGDNLAAIDLGSGRTATAISASNQHTCALLDNSNFKCWGYGNVGQLGKGSTLNLGYSSGQMGDNLTAIDL